MPDNGKLEVVRPGVMTTVQDLGRGGYLAEGIPPSGAFDATALKLANLLVGNEVGEHVLVGGDPGAAGLEMALRGPRLKVLSDSVIAVTGADLQPAVNGQPIDMWTAIDVRAGEEISFGVARHGVRAYLAVAGGIDVPTVLGSRSTNVRAGIGGVEGRALKAGDVLPIGTGGTPADLAGRRIRADRIPGYGIPAELRVVLGPQDHLFTADSVRTFLDTDWKLSTTSDRMGCRFIGPALDFQPRPDYLVEQAGADPSNIVDDSICIGSIQVPSGLEPIVMGVDGPSLGGYAKIATVISPDLSRLAQLRPGEVARFCAIDPDEAHELHVAARGVGTAADLA
ncbi:biotin-dependent carboxyltransferase family protein [Saccharopolyspora sp. K220]|uniref:5-oxoprolinase subunit C family protein n=1 Tax=Saccharopolyspora soli TaxID=2926618 RepID=UPI001F57E135|nr:biotin-dependent carboxyltransferase family protein [Saccharopolyspora soli]MCI2417371.1 biotin-dependent carboxyltransferase family protein [Saccharopolyspora soli]